MSGNTFILPIPQRHSGAVCMGIPFFHLLSQVVLSFPCHLPNDDWGMALQQPLPQPPRFADFIMTQRNWDVSF
ncbi:hypothetical protein EK904_009473 [Melospiza melodia maxima]|nr:hypothetical protein EK904_009473 [Melospiza melodia maxima]